MIASGLGLVLASAMWWAYFDVSALLGEHALANEPVETRPRLGRNAFSFAHYPLVVGIVLVALGLKKVLEYVGDTEKHALTDPLKGVALAALVGGVVALPARPRGVQVADRAHLVHLPAGHRRCPAVGWPLLGKVPAMGQLAVVAALCSPAWWSSRWCTPRTGARSAPSSPTTESDGDYPNQATLAAGESPVPARACSAGHSGRRLRPGVE